MNDLSVTLLKTDFFLDILMMVVMIKQFNEYIFLSLVRRLCIWEINKVLLFVPDQKFTF